jgi:hypothetical protein
MYPGLRSGVARPPILTRASGDENLTGLLYAFHRKGSILARFAAFLVLVPAIASPAACVYSNRHILGQKRP